MNKYKRGDKHPTKNLIFWQYHHPFYKETNGEVWYTEEMFEEKRKLHAMQTYKNVRKHPFSSLVNSTVQRDKLKYKTPKNELITVEFVKELLKKQNNKCYWFNVEMDINPTKNFNIRNPLKLTVDRLNPNNGYTKDNVVLSCYAANCGRANASCEDWLKIVELIKIGLQHIKL